MSASLAVGCFLFFRCRRLEKKERKREADLWRRVRLSQLRCIEERAFYAARSNARSSEGCFACSPGEKFDGERKHGRRLLSSSFVLSLFLLLTSLQRASSRRGLQQKGTRELSSSSSPKRERREIGQRKEEFEKIGKQKREEN